MGEKRASGESILGNFAKKEVCCVKDDHLSIMENIAYLHSFCADKLKYVHSKAFGYNKCEFSSTLEAALMIESMNGETKHDC
jgi:hypothetical protein